MASSPPAFFVNTSLAGGNAMDLPSMASDAAGCVDGAVLGSFAASTALDVVGFEADVEEAVSERLPHAQRDNDTAAAASANQVAVRCMRSSSSRVAPRSAAAEGNPP